MAKYVTYSNILVWIDCCSPSAFLGKNERRSVLGLESMYVTEIKNVPSFPS
jgi:hypothetical protein